MRRLILSLAILLVPFMLLSQTTQTDEIKTLNEKVTTLVKKNNNLQWQLTKFKKSELILNDSLKIQINGINQSITTLNDSISAVKTAVNATDKKVTDLQNSINTFTTIVYISVLLLLVIIIVVYFIVIGKIKATWTKSDNLTMNTKDNLLVEIGKVRKDLESKFEGHSH